MQNCSTAALTLPQRSWSSSKLSLRRLQHGVEVDADVFAPCCIPAPHVTIERRAGQTVQNPCDCTTRGEHVPPLSQQRANIAHEVRCSLLDLVARGVRRVSRSAPSVAHQGRLSHSFC